MKNEYIIFKAQITLVIACLMVFCFGMFIFFNIDIFLGLTLSSLAIALLITDVVSIWDINRSIDYIQFELKKENDKNVDLE